MSSLAAPPAEPAAGTGPGTLTARDAAWLVAVPCAALTVLLIAVVGPLVGDLLLSHSSTTFWSAYEARLRPEPHEQGRFLVALTGPLLIAGAAFILLHRPPRRLPTRLVGQLTWGAQAVTVACAIAFLIVQRGLVFPPDDAALKPYHQRYFSSTTLAVSLLGAAAIVAGARSPRVRALVASWTHETRARHITATIAAVMLTAMWLLHAFTTEDSVLSEAPAALFHLQFTLDETYAVLNGHSPLVDFAAQYGSLWPYPVAGMMALIGKSVGVFTGLMCIISGLALLAMYGVLRRVTRSALTALVLFAPFLATSFFLLRGPLDSRYTHATLFSDYPMRFAGPWFLAWLVARHLEGGRPRRVWPLFLVAGLVAINNADHGVPALAGLLAALLSTGGRPTRAQLRSLALQAAGGLLGAIALLCMLTLVRAGTLPHPDLWLHFARLFAVAGFFMVPMPVLGLHTIIYMTLAGALVLATVRAFDDARSDAGPPTHERVMTGMLAFCGVFGLGSGGYYAGHSHPEVLVTSFAIWSFTLSLLTLVAVRHLAAQRSRWPEPAVAACFVGFCVTACSLAQTPTPWSQVERLQRTREAVIRAPGGQQFVAAQVQPGEHVAILLLLGHRIAENLGVDNVSPYTGIESMPAVQQLDEVVQALREHGGSKLFFQTGDTPPEAIQALQRMGFEPSTNNPEGDMLWVDRRSGAP